MFVTERSCVGRIVSRWFEARRLLRTGRGMTRNDRARDVATTGRRRAKRATSVGRTGARFPSARALEQDEPDGTAEPGEDDLSGGTPAAEEDVADEMSTSGEAPVSDVAHASARFPTPGRTSAADGVHAPEQASAAQEAPAGQGAGLTESGTADWTSVSGHAPVAGARFGPHSMRKPKRGNEFDTGSTPVVDDLHEPHDETPPGEPTPEQSAERTMPLIRPWSGALVRPYAHTGGRTRSSHDLAIEALVSTNGHPSDADIDRVLTTHHRRMIVDLCMQPRSVAEVAALLSVPLGVARVLLGDLATAGMVVVHPTAASVGDGAPDLEFMRRVLVGLRRL